MFSSEEMQRKLVYKLTLYIYRNNTIEDCHSNNVLMNNDFYKKIYRMVSTKTLKVKKFLPYILKAKKMEDYKNIYYEVPQQDRFKFYYFANEVLAQINLNNSWNDAILLDKEPKKNLTKFILDGKFKECCDNNLRLNDSVMKVINIDIHNRIYTLFIKNYLISTT